MRLTSVSLQNFKCHEDLKVDLHPSFNVIVGKNGSGKSSLLEGICDCLAHLPMGLGARASGQYAMKTPGVAREVARTDGGRMRFERQYPIKVGAVAEAFGRKLEWAIQWDGIAHLPSQVGLPPGQLLSIPQLHQAQAPLNINDFPLPALAFFRAHRRWASMETRELQAITERHSRIDGYAHWSDASADSTSFQSWVVAKSVERLQLATERGVSFDRVADDELAVVSNCLAKVLPGLDALRFDSIQKDVLVDWKNYDTTDSVTFKFSSLSDGQKSLVALVADIARRMCLLNPQFGPKVALETPGIVLIDEIDVHLHPEWQRKIVSGLKAAFPNVQFITASHSPQILGEMRPDEVILLSASGTAHPQASYGLDSSQVLEEVMGSSAREPTIRKKLDSLFETLEQNDVSSAKALLVDLEHLSPGIPELSGARALITRKELLGR